MENGNSILQELESLKLKVLMEEGYKHKDEYLYDCWVDEMMGKNAVGNIFIPTEWAKYKTISSLVENLYHKKHFDDAKNVPEIRRVIAEIVSMVMFYMKDPL